MHGNCQREARRAATMEKTGEWGYTEKTRRRSHHERAVATSLPGTTERSLRATESPRCRAILYRVPALEYATTHTDAASTDRGYPTRHRGKRRTSGTGPSFGTRSRHVSTPAI